jgi:hypothetical protein
VAEKDQELEAKIDQAVDASGKLHEAYGLILQAIPELKDTPIIQEQVTAIAKALSQVM